MMTASDVNTSGYRHDPPGTHPPLAYPDYKSTSLRHPKQPLILLPHTLTECTGPVLGNGTVRPDDHDLTFQHRGDPVGQKIIVYGRLLDGTGRPIPDSLIEIWQANAAGRYRHIGDRWDAPLDPNFDGVGRTLTDKQGRYEFVTIKPGAYPWGNHHNAWRPAHIHFSVFGWAFAQRLVTQMYFPDDPLFGQDPIYQSIPEQSRSQLISRFSLEHSKPNWALAFEFDLVVRGRGATPFEEPHHD